MTDTAGGRPDDGATESRPEGGSQTLARGLSALAMIGEDGASLSVPELAGRLGIHRSMAYRLVKTLEQHGFVERSPHGELELGARLASLARGAARSLQTAAAPELAAVADELGMTAFLVGFGIAKLSKRTLGVIGGIVGVFLILVIVFGQVFAF